MESIQVRTVATVATDDEVVKKTQSRSKDETYWEVLLAALELDFRKGHLKWTISDLSRASKITRSLIYYYFGRSKEDILSEGVRYIGEEMFGLSEGRLQMWQEGKVEDSIIASRRGFQKHPSLQAFYFANRFRETMIGDEIRALEKKHQKKMKAFLPHLNDGQLQSLSALIIGLVVAPSVEEATIRGATREVLRMFHPKAKQPLSD